MEQTSLTYSPEIQRAINATPKEPLIIYGDRKLTCEYLYNVFWELCCVDLEFYGLDVSMISQQMRDLAEYITAVLLCRLAKNSDVDMEEGLQQKIDTVLKNTKVPYDDYDTKLFPRKLTFLVNHNKEANIFEEHTLVSEWIGNNIYGTAMFELTSSKYSGHDNPFIWMAGEIEPHSRPMLKENAWMEAYYLIEREIEILYTTPGISLYIIDRATLKDKLYNNSAYSTYDEDNSNPIYKRIYDISMLRDSTLTNDNTAILLSQRPHVFGEDLDVMTLVEYMQIIGLWEDNIEHIIVMIREEGSIYDDKVKELVDQLGFIVYFDDSYQQQDLFSAKYFGSITSAPTPKQVHLWGEWFYMGKVSEDILEQWDKLMVYDIVRQLSYCIFGINTKENRCAYNNDDKKLPQHNKKKKIRNSILKNTAADIIDKLSFGNISLDTNYFSEYENLSYEKRRILLNYYTDKINNGEHIQLPSYDKIYDMFSIYKTYDVFDCYDDAWMPPEDLCHVKIEDEEELSEIIRDIVLRAQDSGIDNIFDALNKGVSLQDIMSGNDDYDKIRKELKETGDYLY